MLRNPLNRLRIGLDRFSINAMLLLLLLALPMTAQAQGTYSTAGYSMAGGRGAVLRDIDAALVNPALLGLPGRSSFSIRLFTGAVHVSQNIMSIRRWNKWQGSFIDEKEKSRFFDSLRKTGHVDVLSEISVLGVQVGPFALGFYNVIDAEARIPADLLKPIEVYPLDENKDRWAIKSVDQASVSRSGNKVDVKMALVRSTMWPTSFEVRRGDTVSVHITNIEQTTDELHGFGLNGYDINVVVDPGETKHVTFKAARPGVFAYYCTNFCSALHQEMQGYLLVR